MGKFKQLIIALPALVLAAGCTTYYGTVLPLENGNYEVVNGGKTKGSALKGAQSDAENTCKKATGNKRFVSIERESEFTGVKIDRGEGGTTRSIIASAVEMAAHIENDTNYENKMTFRCVADGPMPASAARQTKTTSVASAPAAGLESKAAPAASGTDVDDIVKRAMADFE